MDTNESHAALPAYFQSGEYEYRRVAGTPSVYEYNRLNEKNRGGNERLFSGGAYADGYVELHDNGTLASSPVSYAVVDALIERDRAFLPSRLFVPLAKRDYRYYRELDHLLREIDRVRIDEPAHALEVISEGVRYRITLHSSVTIQDAAVGETEAYVDVVYNGIEMTHTLLVVDALQARVLVQDANAQQHTVPTVRIIDMSTDTVLTPEPNAMSEEPSASFDGAHVVQSDTFEVPSERGYPATTEQVFYDTSDEVDDGVVFEPAQDDAVFEDALPRENQPVRDTPAQSDVSERLPVDDSVSRESFVHSPAPNLGEGMNMLAEHMRSDGSVERVLSLPHGRAKITLVYKRSGTVEATGAQSSTFLYPATVLSEGWEKQMSRHRAEKNGDINGDKAARERGVVQRARSVLAFETFRSAFPENSPEAHAVAQAIVDVKRDTQEKYGDVFV